MLLKVYSSTSIDFLRKLIHFRGYIGYPRIRIVRDI